MLLEVARLTNESHDGYLSTPQCHEHVIFLLCVCLFIYQYKVWKRNSCYYNREL